VYVYRIGADENGLGARLGPLLVTAVLARVDESGHRTLSRRLPKRLREDLDDSKRLISHGNVALGEAWARAVAGADARTPQELFERLSLDDADALRTPCPKHVESQCWTAEGESFVAGDLDVRRLAKHLDTLRARGVDVLAARCSVLCTRRLNDERDGGKNRFVSDLHAMERLLLDLRERAPGDVLAICGKVGGMGDYSRFFGPLSHRLHSVIEVGRARSAYHFPGLGEVHFVRDADASDALVMLASLIGKYVRELLMARIARFYDEPDAAPRQVSGYHDPTTARFILATEALRARRRVPGTCFERQRDV
jgi:ribonuclease HII